MRDNKNQSDVPKDSSGTSDPDAPGCEPGFLVLKVKPGNELWIGETVLYFKESTHNSVKIAIKAKKDVRIQKIP